MIGRTLSRVKRVGERSRALSGHEREGGSSGRPGLNPPQLPCIGGQRELGSMPSSEALRGLGLGCSDAAREQPPEDPKNPFASLIPWLTSLSSSGTQLEKAEMKPARYLVAKGLPTLPTKLVEKVWNLEYVEMEEFLPMPRALRIPTQDSLVGALNQFQAIQQHKSQRRAMDNITTWVRCFTLYMAVLSTRAPEMVPSMVAHLHTVLRLQQRALHNLAWLEYDIQFRMEMAASADRAWKCGDPWQYVACLPSQRLPNDPFEVAEGDTLPAPREIPYRLQREKESVH